MSLIIGCSGCKGCKFKPFVKILFLDCKECKEANEDRSGGHWSATSKDSYMNHGLRHKESVTEIKATEKYVQGKVTFDTSLLYFENGIYEFRYHSGNSHKVLLIDHPTSIL